MTKDELHGVIKDEVGRVSGALVTSFLRYLKVRESLLDWTEISEMRAKDHAKDWIKMVRQTAPSSVPPTPDLCVQRLVKTVNRLLEENSKLKVELSQCRQNLRYNVNIPTNVKKAMIVYGD